MAALKRQMVTGALLGGNIRRAADTRGKRMVLKTAMQGVFLGIGGMLREVNMVAGTLSHYSYN